MITCLKIKVTLSLSDVTPESLILLRPRGSTLVESSAQEYVLCRNEKCPWMSPKRLLANPLQLEQLLLFWRAFVMSDTYVCLARRLQSNSSKRFSSEFKGSTLCMPVELIQTKGPQPSLFGIYFMNGSCWNWKGPSPNLLLPQHCFELICH